MLDLAMFVPGEVASPLLDVLRYHFQSSNPNFLFSSQFSTSFLVTKTPKKHKKRRKKPESPRIKPVQHPSTRNPHFESLVERDSYFRFLTRSKLFLSQQQEHVLRLDDAGKLYRVLGFARGRKVTRYIEHHPLLFQIYRHNYNKMWLGFTDIMEDLLEEEKLIMDSMEKDRVNKVVKLLMMSKDKKIPLSKIHHCRLLFGIPDDFRDRVDKYSDWIKISVENDGKRVLELVKWDPNLAISELEREFIVNEDKIKQAFKFQMKHLKDLDLDEVTQIMASLSTMDTSALVCIASVLVCFICKLLLHLQESCSIGDSLITWTDDMAHRILQIGISSCHQLSKSSCQEDTRKLNNLNSLPLVSPYSDGQKFDLWSLEAEKYIHEFLTLTLEKKASIHHIVEFKEELSLTKHTYDMLKKQPRAFYLAGTEMNWVVFLNDAYDDRGNLIHKDPQVVFNDKLYKYALMKRGELDSQRLPCLLKGSIS